MTAPALAALLALAPPAADLRTPEGAPFSLAELLNPGPAVVVLWASWLPGAQEFAAVLPEIERVARARGWRGVLVLFQDDPGEGLARLPRGSWNWPVAVDARGELARRLKLSRAPVVLLLSGEGVVVGQGGPPLSEVRALLESWAQR